MNKIFLFYFRSVLVVLLFHAENLPTNQNNQSNYYIVINLFPQKHKPCQSVVYKSPSPKFKESFEFTIPLQYLLFQSMKFSLWSFDRFSHHEIIADALIHMRQLEKYGLTICRDIFLAKKLKHVAKASYYNLENVSFLRNYFFRY